MYRRRNHRDLHIKKSFIFTMIDLDLYHLSIPWGFLSYLRYSKTNLNTSVGYSASCRLAVGYEYCHGGGTSSTKIEGARQSQAC